ncbi:MAG: replication protein RepA [Deltaproteobacteria bacterium]
MAKQLKPQTIDSLVNHALAIEDEQAQDAEAMGFMARAMVQATLPHRAVKGTIFKRINGDFTLSIGQADPDIGLPFGVIPRLLLAWMTTEAVKTKSRELELGDSMSGFMRRLGLLRSGGVRGDITRLKDQSYRLFSSVITATYTNGSEIAFHKRSVADDAHFWWEKNTLNQTGLWKSTVTLSEHFFNEVIDRPVPIDMRAIEVLKQSSLALDIYVWLTYRVSYMKLPTTIPWSSLALQFGSDYARLRDFKEAFINELKKVILIYPDVRLDALDDCLMIKPSLTHISMAR